MPILWRYLLRSYFQALLLCVCTFIAVLLITRFQDIARFASSGATFDKVALFTLYRIPSILPIAIPVSCLIAAIILFQKLSRTHELTAIRTCGIGLTPIIYPLMLAGVVLFAINFTIVSEIAPRCRALTKELIYHMTTYNPLVLFQKDTMIKPKNTFIDMKVLKSGKYAKDVIFIARNASNGRLSLITAKELAIDGDLLNGKQVSIISSIDPKREESFDHLIIENQTTMNTKSSNISPLTQDIDWYSSEEYLSLRMLLAKELLKRKLNGNSPFSKTVALEISRRLTLAIAAFTFTFIGVAFGMEIGRKSTKKRILWAFALATFFMVCFVSAKSIRHNPFASCIVYLLPHPIIAFFCLQSIRRVSEGFE